MSNNPLESLVSSDTKNIDKKKMADFLKPFIIIDEETKEIHKLSALNELGTNLDKIEILLLASKVRALLFSGSDGMTQAEITILDYMPQGSVKSSLNGLAKTKRVRKDNSGKYTVPNYRIDDIIKSNTIKNKII